MALGPAGVFALGFAVTAGFSIGLLSPLHGLLAVEVYGEGQLGQLSGVQQMLAAVAGAASPWLAGLAVDITGGYEVSLAAVALLQVCALGVFAWHRRATASERARLAEEADAAHLDVTLA